MGEKDRETEKERARVRAPQGFCELLIWLIFLGTKLQLIADNGTRLPIQKSHKLTSKSASQTARL